MGKNKRGKKVKGWGYGRGTRGGRWGAERRRKEQKRQPLHERNIYRSGWRMEQLVELYPEFEKYTQKRNNKEFYTVDFKDKFKLYALSKYSLKRDFKLDVEFPNTYFVPDVPLRIELIIMVQEMLNYFKTQKVYTSETYKGIELVSGSSCVYAALAARMNPNWKLLATEMGANSWDVCRKNIADNGLEEQINFIPVKPSQPLLEGILEPGVVYDFCTYAPIYFLVLDARVAVGYVKDRNGCKGLVRKQAIHEIAKSLVTGRGQHTFINKLVEQSLLFKDRIRLFCVQIGRHSGMVMLAKQLRALVGADYMAVSIVQNKAMIRYNIAWTFFPELKIGKLFTWCSEMVKDLPEGTLDDSDEDPMEMDGEERNASGEEDVAAGNNGGSDLCQVVVEAKGEGQAEPQAAAEAKPKAAAEPLCPLYLREVHSCSNLIACTNRTRMLLEHVTVKFTEEQVGDNKYILNLTAKSVPWTSKKGRYDEKNFADDASVDSDDLTYYDWEGGLAKETEKPVLSAQLTITHHPDTNKIDLTMVDPSGATERAHLKSLWQYLVTWWDRQVLPNFL